MTKRDTTNLALIVGMMLVFACVFSWVTGIDPFGLGFREALTFVSPVVLATALAASFITIKHADKTTKLLRLGGGLLLVLLAVLIVVMAITLGQISEVMKDF